MKKFVGQNKKYLAFTIIIFLLVSSVSGIVYGLTHKQTANAQEPLHSQTQAMNGVDKFVSFRFISDKNVTKENWRNFVDIKNISGVTPNSIFEKNVGKQFTIKAPENGYEEGGNYAINVVNCNFVQGDIDATKVFYFSIKHDKVENVVFASNVKELDKNNVIFFDGEKITTSNVSYVVGDILNFMYFTNDEWGSYSAKVSKIICEENGCITALVGTPKEEEVVTKKKIYGNYTPNIPQDEIEGQLNDKSVENALLNSNYVRAVSEVLGEMYPNQAALQASTKDINDKSNKIINKLIPSFKFEWEDKDYIDENELRLFKLRFIFTWDVIGTKSHRIDLQVKLILTIKKSISTFISDLNGIKNTSTISSTTFGIDIAIVGNLDFSKYTDLSKLNPNIVSTKYFKELKKDKLITNSGEDSHWSDKDYKNVSSYGDEGWKKTDREKTKGIRDARNEKRNAFHKLVKTRADTLNQSKSAIRFINIMVPLCPSVAFSFVLDLIVDFNFSGEFGTLHEISWTDESGTIEYNGKTENYHNESKVLYSGKVYGALELEAKICIRARGGFTFAGIVTLGIQVEGGVYFDAQGVGAYGWGSLNEEDLQPIAFYFEGGAYFDISAFANFDIKIYKKTATVSIYNKKIALFKTEGNKATEDITDFRAASNPPNFSYLDLKMPEVVLNDSGYFEMPALYRAIYSFETEKLTYSPLMDDEYIIGGSRYAYFEKGRGYLRDSSIQEFEDTVIAYLLNPDGTIDDNSFFPIIIKKEPTKVEKIIGYTDYDGIQVGGSISLSSKCEPLNASYQQSEYKLDYVIQNGARIENALENYAVVNDSGMLAVKSTLKIGDKIGIKAHAVEDDVWSDPFEVEVIKTQVKEINIIAEDFVRSITPGEQVQIFPKIYPLNASFPVEEVYISSGEQYGRIIKGSGLYFVECFKDVPLGKTIGVRAVADEGDKESEEYIFTVGAVAVEKVEIADEFGNKILERRNNVNKIQQGASIKLNVVYTPSNATVAKGEYYITDGATSAAIDDEGNLTINRRAKLGTVITVIATAEGVNSSEYSFEVVKIPVEKIELKNYQDTVMVKPNQTVQFYPIVTPSNATYISPVYTIYDGADIATISAYGTLTVSRYAGIGRIIRVTATTDGVTSEAFELTVVPILAERIALYSADDTIMEGNSLQLNWLIDPAMASHADQIAFEIIEGGQYAAINKNGFIIVNDNIPDSNACIKVRAFLDGVYSNIVELKIYVPVKTVEIVFNSGAVSGMRVYMSEKFTAVISPVQATRADDVQYVVTNNANFVTLNNAIDGCYVTVNDNAVLGDRFSVAAIVDGVRSKDYFITVEKTPVEGIDNNCGSVVTIGEGKTFTLNASVYPLNATENKVTYRITQGFDIADIIRIDERKFALQIQSGSDKIGKTVTVIASADGIDGEPVKFTIIKNEVSFVNISDSQAKSVLTPNEQTKIIYAVNADATHTNAVYKITEGSEFARLDQDGTLTVNNFIPVSDARVGVTVTVDGTESNELIYTIFVPISEVYLYADNTTPRTNSTFRVFCSVNQNATDKKVALAILSGGQYIDRVFMDEYGNAAYRVKEGLSESTASVIFKASAQGMDSYELTVNLIAPVVKVETDCGNTLPKQGETVTVNALVYPEFATNKSVKFKLQTEVDSVSVNMDTGEIAVQSFVKEGTKFYVIASADGVSGAPLEFTVQKVPVTGVALYEINGLTEVRVGDSFNLCTEIQPFNATYKTVTYTIIENGVGITVDKNGKVNVSLSATVGAIVKIKATVDGVDSNVYGITLLKQPVTGVQLEYDNSNAYGENTFAAGSEVKLFASVNENATFSDIEFFFTDYKYLQYYRLGAKIGDVQEFVFKIKDFIDIPDAYVTFYALADGVRSKQITLYIYNPIKNIDIGLENAGKITPESYLQFYMSVNAGLNNSTAMPVFTVISGGEFINEIAYGQYKIKTLDDIAAILANDPKNRIIISVKASGDGVKSQTVEFEIFVPVTEVEFTEYPQSLTIGSNNGFVSASALPVFSTETAITYSIVNQEDLPFVTIDSLSGLITVANNKAYIGKNLLVRATASNGLYAECEISIEKVELEAIAVSDDTAKEVMPGAQISLLSTPTPYNATFADNLGDVRYFIKSGDAMLYGNVLTVRSTAAVGSNVIIYAEADGVRSSDFSLSVASAPETAVRLYAEAETDLNNVRSGQKIQFKTEVQIVRPDSEPDFPILYSVSGPATITAGGLLTINAGVKNNTVITVYAAAVGVTKTRKLTVKVPVYATQDTSVVGEGGSVAIALEQSGLFNTVQYYLDASCLQLGTINQNTGVLTVNSDIKGNSLIKAYAVADGVRSNVLEWQIFVPVKNLSVSASDSEVYSYTTQSLMNANVNDVVSLSVSYNSQFASNTSVRYKILAGSAYVQNAVYTNGDYYIYDDYLQIITNIGASGKCVRLQAEVYGAYADPVYSANTQTISIYVPVEEVTLTRDSIGTASGIDYVQQNMSYTFTAAAFPAFANDADITFKTNNSYAELSMAGNKATLHVKNNAELNGTFDIIADVLNGTTARYGVAVEKVWATEMSFSLYSAKDGGSSAVLSKIYAGDTLTAVFEYKPGNVSEVNKNAVLSFSNSSIVTSNAYATIDGNKIKIKSVADMRADTPSLTVYSWATTAGNVKTKIISRTINVYVPVIEISVGLLNADRGTGSNLNIIYNRLNGGYANPAAKTATPRVISVTDHNGNSVFNNVNFDFPYICVPKHYSAGTVIEGSLQTPDGAKTTFSITVKALSLTGNNIYYNRNLNLYQSSSCDSMGRTMLTTDQAQLEENRYTYILGKYNNAFLSDYGVTFTATENSNYATLTSDKKLTITQNAPGTDIVTITVIFIDGCSEKKITKKIKIFNAISGADVTNQITAINSRISAWTNDSLCSNSSNTYDFDTVEHSNYKLTLNGYLTIKNKFANNCIISVFLNYYQLYNGVKLNTFSSYKNVDTRIKSSHTSVFHELGDNGRVTDDTIVYDDWMPLGLSLQTMLTLGYKTLTFTVSVSMYEHNSGYQELYLYLHNAYIEPIKLWENTVIEHGGDKKNSNWQTHTFSFTKNIVDIPSYNSYHLLCLGYSAHGNGSDDWERGDSKVIISAS